MSSSGTGHPHEPFLILRATTGEGEPETRADWKVEITRGGKKVPPSSAPGQPSCRRWAIGENATVGQAAWSPSKFRPHSVVAGNPARVLRV